MYRFVRRTLFFALFAVIGCGKSSEVAENQNETVTNVSESTAGGVPSPVDVVSQFLDSVRRGGQDSDAGGLLTQRAQLELKRIGRAVQPIGSPDARFNVTRSEAVPGEANSALVHSIWTEPGEGDTTADYQVVWALHRESAGWRISGLVMELQPGEEPTVIDFENGELMAQLLSGDSQASNPAASQTSQATAPSSKLAR